MTGYEYLEQAAPLGQVGNLCNAAAKDRWELFGLVPCVLQTSALSTEAVPGASCVFRRRMKTVEANGLAQRNAIQLG